MKVRTFVCVELPEAERARLGELQSRARRHGARVSWTAPHNIHLTLAFLGDVEPERIGEVAEAVRRAAARSRPFELRVEGTGGFPTLSRPRVLWAGVAGDVEALGALQAGLADELEAVGFPRERRAFSPHLTIGRPKDDRDRALGATAREVSSAGLRGEPFRVAELVLMRSDLGPGGARYTPLSRAPLGSAE